MKFIRSVSIGLCLMATAAALTACSGGASTRSAPVATTTVRHPEVTRPSAPVDTGMGDPWAYDQEPASATPVARPPAAAPNPAAESLVSRAVEKLNANDLASAEWHLEEAIRLAPSYGPAYYWMAKVKYSANDMGQAENFLNKAQTLAPLGSEWLDRIEALRGEIRGASR